MDMREAIIARHSVRQFQDLPIDKAARAELEKIINECNEEGELDIQLILNDSECFDTFLAHFGRFSNVKNYVAIVGNSALPDLEERGGYYGQKVVLKAQMLGLNTCWVGGTYGKGKCKVDIEAGEKLVCVIAIGYGESQGKMHKSKPLDKVCGVKEEDMPAWFKEGMEAALMAPTALNQQKFYATLEGDQAVITAKKGAMTKIDLGIVKYNFEAASGHKCS